MRSNFGRRLGVALVLLVVMGFATFTYGDPIHDAARKGNLVKVTELVKADPSLASAKDKFGKTPLHLAAENDHPDVAEFLLANGADANAKDGNGGFTPLDLALSLPSHYMDMVQLLVAHGADVNARSGQGQTPLIGASMRGEKDAVILLLSKDADVNARDDKGNTALLWSMLLGHQDVAILLVNANADVNERNNQGLSPLFLAQRRSYSKMVELLRQHGAQG